MCGFSGLVKLRLCIHAQKPSFIILTETRIDNPDANLNNLNGYYCKQVASSGERSKEVAVFYRRGIEIMEDTVYNHREGYYSVAVYMVDGSKYIVVHHKALTESPEIWRDIPEGN
jgi:hypothetical protein